MLLTGKDIEYFWRLFSGKTIKGTCVKRKSWGPKSSESEVTQSCPTLCDPMDCSPPGSSLHGIFQAIVLEWIAISFSRGSSWPRDRTLVSCIAGWCFTGWATRESPKEQWKWKWKWSRFWLFATPWAVAYQAPPSVEFSRQKYWSGLLFPSPGDLPYPGIKPRSSALQAEDALPSEPPGSNSW